MRLVAGPRQVGKTTLARAFLEKSGCPELYYNWDLRSIRSRFREDPYFYNADALKLSGEKERWICFDEIHKFPGWKDILKDAFDSFEEKYRFVVTGSARLDLFRKAGDSLSGRFFFYRLLPVSLFELTGRGLVIPDGDARDFVEGFLSRPAAQSDMEHLIAFSGFPEPLLKGDEVFSSSWHDAYLDTLVRGDLRDLTKIHELENVVTLLHLLPERVGAPLSINSLREDMGASYNAVRNYVRALNLTYVIFAVAPYQKKIARAIKKESKVYLFDWTIILDEAKRFENYIACELKHRAELWTTVTKCRFDLSYVRTRDGKESDFLITRDGRPYLLLEAKLSSEEVEPHHLGYARQLGTPFVQIVKRPGIAKASKEPVFVISAANFLS